MQPSRWRNCTLRSLLCTPALILLLINQAAAQFQGQNNTRVTFDARGLQRYLNDPSVPAITMGVDVQLNSSDWLGTTNISRSVLIEGAPNVATRTVLDLGQLVNAIYIEPEGQVEFRNLVIQNGAPQSALDPAQVATLPQQIGSNIWPSVVTDANATIVYNNSDLRFYEPVPGANCQEYNGEAITALNLSSVQFTESPDGSSLYLAGENIFPEPLTTRTSSLIQGEAILHSINSSQSCVEFMAPALAPAAANAPGGGVSAVPATQAGSSGLSGGGIAGVVVGAVIAAALAAALIFLFVWRRTRARRDDAKGADMELSSTGTTASTSTTKGAHKHSESSRDSDDPIQRFMASKNSYGTSSSAPSSGSGSQSSGGMMQFEWRIEPSRIQISRRPNGKPHKLGAGGCGTVYKAVLDDVMEVAVKFLKTEGAEGVASNMRQFASEVDIMRACRDPHIVNFLGAWIDQGEGVAYLVQEFLEEGDLASALSNAQRAPEYAWENRGRKVALDIAQGLYYLHSNNIIHFDIKSANCIMDKAKTAKLADVGLSHALTSKSHLSVDAMRGTWAYASPEVCTGTSCTFKSDVWSFGVLLWEIITAERPQRGRYRPIRYPEECPKEIAELVDECMRTEPDGRPTAKEVVQVLLPYGRQ